MEIKVSAAHLALAALLLSSCATTRQAVRDELPPGEPRGFVSFYTAGTDEMTLQIVRLENGVALPPLRSGDAWSGIGDFRIACSPGPHEFVHRPAQGEYS